MLSRDAVTRCVHLSDSNLYLVWYICPTLLGSPGFPTAIQVQVSDSGEDRWPLLESHCSEMRNSGLEWKTTLLVNSHQPQKQPGPVVQLLNNWLEFSQDLILLYDLKVLCSSKLQKVVALTKWIPDVLWWRGIQLQSKGLTRAQPYMNPCCMFNTRKSEAEVSSLCSLIDIHANYQLVSWTVR